MLVDCPDCTRTYHVRSADLGRGRTLVCPHCDAHWFQEIGDAKAADWDLEVAGVSACASSRLDEAPAVVRRPRLPRPVLVVAAIALTCLGFVALVVGRVAVVRAVPRAAAIYAMAGMPVNVVGLAFSRVSPERLASSDVTIRGTLRNIVGRRIAVPRLAFEVRDATGAALVAWSETIPTATLAAGRELAFASAPHRLPAESRTVVVRFD